MCVLRKPGAKQAVVSSCHSWPLPIVKKVFDSKFDQTHRYWKKNRHERSLDGKCSRKNKFSAQLLVSCCAASSSWTLNHSSWRRGPSVPPPSAVPSCWDALFVGSEGCYLGLFAQWLLEYLISYLAELWWKFITLPWSFDFREVVFVFVASLVCLLHF